jgi:hypothetical protein
MTPRKVVGIRIMGSRWRKAPLAYKYAVYAYLANW